MFRDSACQEENANSTIHVSPSFPVFLHWEIVFSNTHEAKEQWLTGHPLAQLQILKRRFLLKRIKVHPQATAATQISKSCCLRDRAADLRRSAQGL